jgi:hypothetical protein
MSKLSVLVLLLAATPAFADDVKPDGCYQLGILVPKTFVDFTSADAMASTVVPIGHDICLESKKVQTSKDTTIKTGEFEIRIRQGTKLIAAYYPKAMVVDGSGSHEDFVFAANADVLRKAGRLDDYARGNRGPIENTIFYILTTDNKQPQPVKRKAGDRAGTVTIGDLRYALIVK